MSVIVPVRNGGPALTDLIQALAAQTLDHGEFEVIIADDGSNDGAVEALAADGRWLRVTRGPPRNAYYARNRAAGLARGEVLAFTDADCRPFPDWLEEGVAGLEEADLVAGRIQMEVPPRYTAWALIDLSSLDQERFVANSTAVTANLFVRRSRFEELGGFDASLPSGGDFNFTRRCVAAGGRLAFSRSAAVSHPSRNDARSYLSRMWRKHHVRAVRQLQQGQVPAGLVSARLWLPFFGIGLRMRLGYPLGNDRRRLAECGIPYRWRDELRTFPLRYLLLPYWAGLAQVVAWLRVRRRGGMPAKTAAENFDPYPAAPPPPGPEPTWKRAASPDQDQRPRISVIVPVRNGGKHLDALLEALRAQTLSRQEFEVIVADDGSTDGSTDQLVDDGRWLRLAPGPPRNRPTARNRGAALASGQSLAFTDADCRPQPDWLENGLAALRDSDVVAGRVRPVLPERRNVWALLDASTWLDLDHLTASAGGMTANLFMERALFEHIGGFDESLPSEDVDLVARCYSVGARVEFAPHALVEHPVLDDAMAFLKKVWRRNRGVAIFAHRNGQRPNRCHVSSWLPLMNLVERRLLGLPLGLGRRRAAELGIGLSLADELRTLPARVLLMPYWAGAAQLFAWLTAQRKARADRRGLVRSQLPSVR